MPRILFLNHAAQIGGAEFGMFDVVTELRQHAHVLLFEDGPLRTLLTDAGVSVTVCDFGALHDVRRDTAAPSAASVRSLLAAARDVRRMAAQYDMVYANSQKAMIVGSVAELGSRRPFVWHLHDILETPTFSRLNVWADVQLARLNGARVIAVSRAAADAFVRAGGERRAVRVVYNGIDHAAIERHAASGAALRRSLGLSDVPLVGCFSRLARWKGQLTLLQAVAPLPGVHVLLAGGPLFGELAYERELRDAVHSLRIEDRVHFLGQRSDVAALLHVVDVVVHPSIAPEPFARTLIEAMMAGHAPVATRCGGVPELVMPEETGFLFPPGDTHALTTLLERLLANPDELRQRSAHVRAYARKRFSRDAYVAGIVRQLQNTMGRPLHRSAPSTPAAVVA
ncbi:MAG: glycosyltransferase family 4 protein [Gemmatimonadaceae bacterium]|nr:glycosyltransferase family 4 protein [Gemmatimonadaceae bacterium]